MKIIKFYSIVFLYSWGVWGFGLFFLKGDLEATVLVSLGGLGPVVGALFYFVFYYSKAERQDYLKRLFTIKSVPIRIGLWSVGIPLLLILIPSVIKAIIAGYTKDLRYFFTLDQGFLASGWFYPIFLIFFGPIPEEMAWRGIALNYLIKKGYLKAQLIVAFLWAVWHFPLFFIQGSYHYGLGQLTLDFWVFFINIIFTSFITGWLYLKSNNSIFIAIVFHYFINLFGEMFYEDKQTILLKAACLCITGTVLLVEPMLTKKKEHNFDNMNT